MTAAIDSQAERTDVATVLRDLAWTIHRRVPDITGVDSLPATELAVLKHVLDSPGITVTEMSKRMGLKQSNTSAAVRTLTERGLVTRQSIPTDRRVSRLIPTDEALARDEAIAAAWSGPIRAGIAQLDGPQGAALETACEALLTLNQVLRAKQAG